MRARRFEKQNFAGVTIRCCVISLWTLSACAPVAPAPVTPVPSGGPSAMPASTVSPEPRVSLAPSASPSRLARTLSGFLWDDHQTPVSGGQVTVRSLDRDVEFEAQALSDASGSYKLDRLPPPGVTLEAVVSAPGWTTRRRVFTAGSGNARLNFGGEAGEDRLYFLSQRPEITAVSPVQDEEWTTREGFRFTLRLSHKLDVDSEARFANALRIVPANREAGGERGGAIDVSTLGRSYPFQRPLAGLAGYFLTPGDLFREDSPARASVEFDATGLEATLRFEAPLLTGFRRARYQVALVSDGQPLRAENKRVLGTGADGRENTWPPAGELILGAFFSRDPDVSSVEGLPSDSLDARWAATHDHVAPFWLAADTDVPQLERFEVRTVQRDTVLRLQFNEPMVAFNGTSRGSWGKGIGSVADDLSHLTFVVDERDKLSTQPLEKVVESDVVTVDPTTQANFGALAERGVPFRFAPAAFTSSLNAAGVGRVYFGPDARDPNTLQVVILERPRFFSDAIDAFAVRVEGVGDPAENVRRADHADDNIVTAEF